MSTNTMNSWLSSWFATAAVALLLLSNKTVHAQEESATSTIQCREWEAPLQVKYNVGPQIWDNIQLLSNETEKINTPFLTVRPSGDIGSSTAEELVTYNPNQPVQDYEVCIPREGACFELVIAMFPPSSYVIFWDGERVSHDEEFPYWEVYPITSTELGDTCTPICDESTEALFTYKYWTGGIGLETYRVHLAEDENGELIVGCDANCHQGLYFSLFKDRECLPRNTCYQFTAGSEYQWIADYHANAPLFSVHFDGRLIRYAESWLFESFTFGENCPCDVVDEDLVEFFMTRDIDCKEEDKTPDFGWELRLADYFDPKSENVEVEEREATRVLRRGMIPGCANTSLFHERMCIPKDSCATFTLASPSSDETYSPDYHLTSMHTTYRSGKWNISDQSYQTTNIGRCTMAGLCDPTTQALLDLELETSPEFITDDGKDAASINYYDISWYLKGYVNENGNSIRSWDYISSSYDLGSIYRTIECVPKANCVMNFIMTAHYTTPYENYTLWRNGELMEDEEIVDGERVTQFGRACTPEYATGLSTLAIAGIACAAGVLVGTALTWSFAMWRHRETKTIVEQPTQGNAS